MSRGETKKSADEGAMLVIGVLEGAAADVYILLVKGFDWRKVCPRTDDFSLPVRWSLGDQPMSTYRSNTI
ncbi:MAG: hypothetical protein HKN85_03575 [Gammaproteobacteria bacterium]|nr:hypothetical protein [Gammaproteobacteria bacterium]